MNASYPTQKRNRDIVSADLDRDGDLDLAILSSVLVGYKGQTDIWLNDGTGTFLHNATYADLVDVLFMTALDADSDGDMDLVTVASGTASSSARLLRNTGSGSFSVETLANSVNLLVGGVSAEDIDFDGDIDIFMSNYFTSTDNLVVLHNNGSGSFGNYDWYSTGGSWWAYEIVANDIDNDGDVDLAVTNSDPWPVGGFLTIHSNNGTGNISSRSTVNFPIPSVVYT